MSELYYDDLLNDANLEGYYRFVDSDGLTTDSSGNSRTLTNQNGVSASSGKFGNAADLGASNTTKFLKISNNYDIGNGKMTFAFHFNLTTAPAEGAMQFLAYTFQNTTYIQYTIYYINDSGTYKLVALRNKEGVGQQSAPYTVTLTTGVWYHIAMTYDNTDLKLYLNASNVATQAASGDGSSAGAAGSGIGAAVNGAYKASGLFDDVAIFSRDLTSTEITRLRTLAFGVSDAQTFAESLSKGVQKKTTDDITFAEGLVRKNIKNLTSDISLTETEIETVGHKIELEDGQDIVESMARTVESKISILDEIELTGVMGCGVTHPLSESLSIAVVVANKETLAISDELGILDSALSSTVSFVRELSDTLDINEGLTEAMELSVGLEDEIAIESEVSNVVGKYVIDSVTLDENIEQVTATVIELSDTQTVGDIVVFLAGKPLEETALDIDEGIVKAIVLAISDEITITEDLFGEAVIQLAIEDAQGLDEAYSVYFVKELADEIAIDGESNNSIGLFLSDEIAIDEGLSAEFATVLALDDSQTIDESVVNELIKNIGDTVDIAVELVVSNVVKLSLDDELEIQLSVINSVSKQITDDVSILESVGNQSSLAVSDNQAIADQDLTSVSIFLLELSDSLDIEENCVPIRGLFWELIDNIELDASVSLYLQKDVYAAIGFVEELSNGLYRPVTDETDVSEGLQGSVNKGISDDIAIIETVGNQTTFVLRVTESIAESFDKAVGYNRSLSDSIELVDGITNAVNKGNGDEVEILEGLEIGELSILEDAIVINEAIGLGITYHLTDIQPIAEEIGINISIGLTDSLSIDDGIDIWKGFALADGQEINEGLVLSVVFERAIQDTLSISEGMGNATSLSISDAVEINESIEVQTVNIGVIEDEILISELMTLVIGMVNGDDVAINEGIDKTVGIELSDGLNVIEQVSLVNNKTLEINDTIDLLEQSTIKREIGLEDLIAFSESAEFVTPQYLEISDGIAIDESVSLINQFVVELTDTLDLSEAINIGRGITNLLVDQLIISEDVGITKGIGLSDQIIVSEEQGLGVYISFTDNLPITEVCERSVLYNRALLSILELSEVAIVCKGRLLSDNIDLSASIVSLVGKKIADNIILDDELLPNEGYETLFAEAQRIKEAQIEGQRLYTSEDTWQVLRSAIEE